MMLKGAKMARLGSSIAPFFQCVKLYYIKLSCYRVKSGSRVNYALISDFFFCGKEEHC